MSSSRTYKYYDFCMAAFVCILLCANLIGPAKATTLHLPIIGPVTFLAGVLFFPISYFFGDVFTEVYGYGRDRRVVWAGFGALVFASIMAATVVALPPAAHWVDKQPAIASVFGSTPRIIAGSISAFWCGSFVNSYVLAKLKLLTKGRWLWTRTIGSTMCGEAVDSAIFYTLAFYGAIENSDLVTLAVTQYVLKVLWEVLSTPLTYWLVNKLKKLENEDYYDHSTDFSPFTLRT
jgi:queuosine precursor transporter